MDKHYRTGVKGASIPSTAIGAALKKRRMAEGLSQPEFAVKYGLKTGTLQRWEQGKSVPRLDAAIAFMKALGYDALLELDIDLGTLMDVLRGDMSQLKREAHHWIDEIFRSGNEELKEKVVRDLRRLGGMREPKR